MKTKTYFQAVDFETEHDVTEWHSDDAAPRTRTVPSEWYVVRVDTGTPQSGPFTAAEAKDEADKLNRQAAYEVNPDTLLIDFDGGGR